MIHLPTPDAATDADYQQMVEHLAVLEAYLDKLGAAELGGDPRAPTQAHLAHAWDIVVALNHATHAHALLNHLHLDFDAVRNVTAIILHGHRHSDPDEVVEALLPTANSISAILHTHSPCECLLEQAQTLKHTLLQVSRPPRTSEATEGPRGGETRSMEPPSATRTIRTQAWRHRANLGSSLGTQRMLVSIRMSCRRSCSC